MDAVASSVALNPWKKMIYTNTKEAKLKDNIHTEEKVKRDQGENLQPIRPNAYIKNTQKRRRKNLTASLFYLSKAEKELPSFIFLLPFWVL